MRVHGPSILRKLLSDPRVLLRPLLVHPVHACIRRVGDARACVRACVWRDRIVSHARVWQRRCLSKSFPPSETACFAAWCVDERHISTWQTHACTRACESACVNTLYTVFVEKSVSQVGPSPSESLTEWHWSLSPSVYCFMTKIPRFSERPSANADLRRFFKSLSVVGRKMDFNLQ